LQAPSAPTQANWRPTLQPQREYTTSTSQIQHSFRLGTAHGRFEMHDRPKRPSAAWKDLTKRERMAGGATSPMKRAGIISIFAVLVVAVSVAALHYELRARADEALPELLELAPADSTFIAYTDVASLRQSPLVQKATALAQPAATDNDYQEFVRGTGFDYQQDLDRVLVAGKTDAAPGSTIAVAEGRFDQKKIKAYALRTGKTENEQGRTVYIVPSTTPGKTFSFSFLSASRIAFSDGDDAFATPGAFSNSKLDGTMHERLSRVAGAPLFVAAKVPTPAPNATAPTGAPALVSSLFKSVSWVEIAARPDGDNVIVSAEAECGTPEDAQKVATALELMRTIVQGAMSGYKGDKQLSAENLASIESVIKAATITTAADRARLLFTMTPDVIKLPTTLQPAPNQH